MKKANISFFCRWALQTYRQSLMHRFPSVIGRIIAWCMPIRYQPLLKNLEYWVDQSLLRFQGACIADMAQFEQCIDGTWRVTGWAFGWNMHVSAVTIVIDEISYPCRLINQERFDVWVQFPAEQSLTSGFEATIAAHHELVGKQVGIQILIEQHVVDAVLSVTEQHLVPSPVVLPNWFNEQCDSVVIVSDDTFLMDVAVPVCRVAVHDRAACVAAFVAARELLIPDQALLELLRQETPLLKRSGALPQRVVDIFPQKIEYVGL